MEAVSRTVFVVLQNYGLTWQHFPSADLTVAGIGAIVLRRKATYCKKSVTPFPWLPFVAPPRRILLGRTNFNFSISMNPKKEPRACVQWHSRGQHNIP
jgi:hypothetical protein